MSGNYPLLLAEAARLYEKHEAGRRDTFNVFSVLRSESDEVNLHSRFLAALLDYRKSPDKPRRNLEDFLRSFVYDDKRPVVVGDTPRFEPGMIVERESDNIDILIHDPHSNPKRAVVIENKIYAGDQPRQLKRYTELLQDRGYPPPHVLYLTLDGHEASEDSADRVAYKPVSYEGLIPWLKRCQEYAYDVPALRESVAQYLHLVQKLTGTDFTEAYMKGLKELCLKDNNFVLVHDLSKAMDEAQISLLVRLWEDIKCEMEKIPNILKNGAQYSGITEERIRKFVTNRTSFGYHGLHYLAERHTLPTPPDEVSGPATLGVEVGRANIYIGVRCHKVNEEKYKKITELKDGLKGGKSPEDCWPWWEWHQYPMDVNLKNPNRENLKLLADDCERKKYAADIAARAGEVWQRLQNLDLA